MLFVCFLNDYMNPFGFFLPIANEILGSILSPDNPISFEWFPKDPWGLFLHLLSFMPYWPLILHSLGKEKKE